MNAASTATIELATRDAGVPLRAHGIVKRFGGVTAVGGVDLSVDAGEIVGLIGPNGAGKTTLFNCLSGYLAPDEGRVELHGRDVTDWPVEERARAGLGRTFQRLEVFGTMTVRDHLLVSLEHAGGSRDSWLRSSRAVGRRADEALERFRLLSVANEPAEELPTATLRRVEIARAACTGATVLLLDEPASGLDPGEVEELSDLLAEVRADGHGVLLVEHDVGFVLGLADRLVVLQTGTVIAEGAADDVIKDPEVRRAYLGEGD